MIDSSRNRIFRLRFGVLNNSNIFLSIPFSMHSHPSVQQQQIPLSLVPWKLHSPHLLPPGPKAAEQARTPPAHCQELLSPLAWAVTHFLQLQTLSGSPTGSTLAQSHGWGSFFLTHGLGFTCLQSQKSKSSPSTAPTAPKQTIAAAQVILLFFHYKQGVLQLFKLNAHFAGSNSPADTQSFLFLY